MKYNESVFCHQYPVVKAFLQHAIFYRVTRGHCQLRQISLDYWIATNNAHCLQAIINWCMVFGSDSFNATHWKKLSTTDDQSLVDDFRYKCFKTVGINQSQLDKYWDEMTTFRNEYAAHRGIYSTAHVPNLDLALEIAHFYDGWIREVIQPAIFDEPLFSETEKHYHLEVTELMKILMPATEEFQRTRRL